jgi:vacuolar-type H+-ATPase subunit I/STV1
MRKPNLEIKKLNLAKARLQFTALVSQHNALVQKASEVGAKARAKEAEVDKLTQEVTDIESSTTVA